MRIKQSRLDQVLDDEDFFWVLRNKWRGTDHCIDIDKAWHGIHYLFNQKVLGGTPPAKWVIFGDKEKEISHLNGGHGPAHYLTHTQVSKVSDHIKGIPLKELKKRYDPTIFQEKNIYPQHWDENEWNYLLLHYNQLKNFYQKAADNSENVLMAIFP
ncbi:hypothetical protein LCGC14_0529840 [marine sediment metagenome]|uniref:DUF1877 domain-containing protein n=1 Tax=marine sediment metagenome TaxID=412755 RepID=A0A0F9SED5_9ZZZZ|nr:MAG: hypothetical protein Lokiarch_38280 [Candidatus Lokiarchaeum sp. GC14_75]